MIMKLRHAKRPRPTQPDQAHQYCTMPSPVGELLLVADESALTGLYFVGRDHVPGPHPGWTLNAEHRVLREAAKQLSEYFAGKRVGFSLPLRLAGTHFQKKVWQQIALIPHGQTIHYGELAKRA